MKRDPVLKGNLMTYVYKCVRCKDQTEHTLEWVKSYIEKHKIEIGLICTKCNTPRVVELATSRE